MARMAIDDMFMRDPRVRVLAKLCGISMFDARGRLLEVWSICYDRVSAQLSELVIDTAAEFDGFAKHMVEAELAVRVDEKVLRVSGAKQRIKYLEAKSEAGRRGGLKSGEARRNKDEAKPKQKLKQSEAPLNPPDLVPSTDPVKKEARPLDAFDSYFRETHGGSKPTWNDKTVGMLNVLVKKHGAAEVISRIQSLRERPPKWPPAPWDLPTFIAHFDKCAPSQPSIAWVAPIA